jgi:hypothetical protein
VGSSYRLWLFACLFCLSACTQWRYDLGEPLAETGLASHGEATELGVVLQRLGPPLRVAAIEGGYLLAWEHWYIAEDTLGFSLGALGADFLTVDWGTARATGEFLLLTFDREHRVSGGGYAGWDSEAGGGHSLQPLAGFVAIVDVNDLLERLPQHRWGAASLQSLPVTLNASSAVDAGQSGLEQRGTPKAAGQHSLEINNR